MSHARRTGGRGNQFGGLPRPPTIMKGQRMSSHQHRKIEKRAVVIPDSLSQSNICARVVTMPRAPWDAANSKLEARPETAPRQIIILVKETRRRGIKGRALGNLMRSMIAEELRHLREENYPAEVII
ncbi:hypothetical protein [Thioclava sp. GXIMD2076]|uniref:hypothetical protein n=1 Tax=Thioclava sp. GXIMD2076 TaxID=3131931 RepID=UPI0030D1873F